MFLTGEFSRIARVSKRLLQYYDEIGLLKPAHIDPQTGYRYYSARQLPRLNRILALKELGLSLDQIARMLDDDISDDEIRGMLLMQKAQVEQSLRQELQRFHRIESRLQQHEMPDVALKSVPAQQFLSMRTHVDSFQTAGSLIRRVASTLPPQLGKQNVQHFAAINHSDTFVEEDIDVELGFILSAPVSGAVTLSDERTMVVRELPAVETMATVIHIGGEITVNQCYSVIGQWIEDNSYHLIGPHREVFVEFPFPARDEDIVIEIQFPVESRPDLLLPTQLD